MRHVGVDGCPAGWFAVTRSAGRLTFAAVPTIHELVKSYPESSRIFIDIPIGLPWSDVPIRPCDRLARQALGAPRRSSVFAVPCRNALDAADRQTASAINDTEMGRKLAAQTWSISAKIKEVDRFLRKLSAASAIREIHPEVCFWALAGKKPMKHRKAKRAGQTERLKLLKRHEPEAADLLKRALAETARKDVRADDIVDSLVAFVTAAARGGTLQRLVGQPSHDQKGLPMEMVYWEDHVT